MAPKKSKKDGDAGKGAKEALPSEKEQTLIIRVDALEEQLARVRRERDEAVKLSRESKNMLMEQDADRREQVEYLKVQLDSKRKELSAFENQMAELKQSKETDEKKLDSKLARALQETSELGQQLEEKEEMITKLKSQLVELGQLKANAETNEVAKTKMNSELEDARAQLHESQLSSRVLAVADDPTIGGEDGAKVLPLLLLEAVRLHIDKRILVEQGLIALQYVLSSDRHADASLLTKKGAVDIVLGAMYRHVDGPDLQSAACGFLWKLAFADSAVRDLVVSKDGLPLIMGAMQRYADHQRLHYNACGALRHILVTAPVTFSGPAQVQAGRRNHHLPPVAAPAHGAGVGSRRNITGRRSGAGERLSVATSVAPRAVLDHSARGGLRGTTSNPDLPKHESHRHGSGRPSTVSHVQISSRHADAVDSRPATKENVAIQAMKLTLRSMAAHAGAALVQEYGCGTLYNLAVSNPGPMRKEMYAEGCVQLVLNAMRTHPTVAGIILNSCALLKQLAEYPPCVQLMDEGGAKPLIVELLSIHQINDELVARASEVLRYLPDHEM